MNRRPGKKNRNKWEDHYARKARKENRPARSVYKLEEIQSKYQVIRKGDRVLDLGCAPGSWLQFAAEKTGPGGRVIGIDKKPVKAGVPKHVTVLTGDMNDMTEEMAAALGERFNVVLSDMAPATIGNKFVDAARSMELCRIALDTARRCLLPEGSFVCKIFQGEDFKAFSDSVRQAFRLHKIYKPQSCRKASKEIYIIGKGIKQEALCRDTANGLP